MTGDRPLFTCSPSRQRFGQWVGGLLLLAAAAATGCDDSPPPVTDPAKAPWLLDPKSQIAGLKNEDSRIRGISAFNLGNMGAKAAEAVSDLERMTESDPNPKVRESAREALEKIRTATGKSSE